MVEVQTRDGSADPVHQRLRKEIEQLSQLAAVAIAERDKALRAVADERERCAKVVEDWAEQHAAHLSEDVRGPLGRHRVAMNDGYALAAAIRAGSAS